MAETLFEWRLSGNISPETLSARVLGEIIIGLEKAVVAVAKDQHPNLKVDGVVFALTDVGEGSARLRFTSPMPIVILAATTALTIAVSTRTFDALPTMALEGLDKVVKVARKHNLDSELLPYSEKPPVARIRAAENLDVYDSALLKGDSEIFGKLIRMGGEGSDASLQLRLSDDTFFTCQCNERLTRQLMSEKKLYEIIGLRGVARWNNSFDLVRFRATELLPYNDTDIVTAFDELRGITSGVYDDISDVNAYIQELRGA